MRKKKSLNIALISFLLLYMIFFPNVAFHSAKSGLKLWLFTVVPTLLPFMILSNYVIESNLTADLFKYFHILLRRFLGTSQDGTYALIIGLFCGYPMGVKTTCDLYAKQRITKGEALYLSTISNNASPMFLIAYILTTCLGAPNMALYTFFILCLSNSIIGAITKRLFYPKCERSAAILASTAANETTSTIPPFGATLDVSIMNSLTTALKLGGYIIIFSILSTIVRQCLHSSNIWNALLVSTLEITTGTNYLHTLPIAFSLKYPFIIAITAMGGFCVAAQSQSQLAACSLSFKPYLLSKLANMFLTFLLAYLLIILI